MNVDKKKSLVDKATPNIDDSLVDKTKANLLLG